VTSSGLADVDKPRLRIAKLQDPLADQPVVDDHIGELKQPSRS